MNCWDNPRFHTANVSTLGTLPQFRADQPMASLSKMTGWKISLDNGIHCYPNIFISFAPPPSLYCAQYVYTHISACVQTVYELPLLPNNTAVKHFYTNRSCVKCWLDIYCWGAGLAVSGRIGDTGQKFLHSSFGNWANMWHWTERFTVFFW
jgi:hypothetical protein